MKLQCGYEYICKTKNCLDCRRFLKLKTNIITLAEASCIEDFGIVDLTLWEKEKPRQTELAQKIMRKLDKKINWKELK